MKKEIWYAVLAACVFALGCLVQWLETNGPEWAQY